MIETVQQHPSLIYSFIFQSQTPSNNLWTLLLSFNKGTRCLRIWTLWGNQKHLLWNKMMSHVCLQTNKKATKFQRIFLQKICCVLCKNSAARSAQSEGSVDPLKCATHLILPRCITNTWPKVNFSSFSRSLSVRHFMGHFSRITYGF